MMWNSDKAGETCSVDRYVTLKDINNFDLSDLESVDSFDLSFYCLPEASITDKFSHNALTYY